VGDKRIVGKCSICGGIVSVPTVFLSVVPPVPTCESCGASEDQTANLPTVPMRPREHLVRRSGRFRNLDNMVSWCRSA
jgi:hypothetical protein